MSTSATTPNISDNPFDTPLPSEVHEHQQASAATVAAGGNPFDDPLPSEKAEAKVNNNQPLSKQIMGQPFVDEVRSTFSHDNMGKSLNLGAGFAGGAGVGSEVVGGAEKLLQISETALEHLCENYPQLTKLAAKLGYGVGAAGAYKLLNKLGLH